MKKVYIHRKGVTSNNSFWGFAEAKVVHKGNGLEAEVLQFGLRESINVEDFDFETDEESKKYKVENSEIINHPNKQVITISEIIEHSVKPETNSLHYKDFIMYMNNACRSVEAIPEMNLIRKQAELLISIAQTELDRTKL